MIWCDYKFIYQTFRIWYDFCATTKRIFYIFSKNEYFIFLSKNDKVNHKGDCIFLYFLVLIFFKINFMFLKLK